MAGTATANSSSRPDIAGCIEGLHHDWKGSKTRYLSVLLTADPDHPLGLRDTRSLPLDQTGKNSIPAFIIGQLRRHEFLEYSYRLNGAFCRYCALGFAWGISGGRKGGVLMQAPLRADTTRGCALGHSQTKSHQYAVVQADIYLARMSSSGASTVEIDSLDMDVEDDDDYAKEECPESSISSPEIPHESSSILETDDSEVYTTSISCDNCGESKDEPCWNHVIPVSDKSIIPLAMSSLPFQLDVRLLLPSLERRIFAKMPLSKQTQFGPLIAPRTLIQPKSSSYYATVNADANHVDKENLLYYDLDNDRMCNWMKYVRFTENPSEQNMAVYLHGQNVVFVTTSIIPGNEELKVGYSRQYAELMGKIRPKVGTKVMDEVDDFSMNLLPPSSPVDLEVHQKTEENVVGTGNLDRFPDVVHTMPTKILANSSKAYWILKLPNIKTDQEMQEYLENERLHRGEYTYEFSCDICPLTFRTGVLLKCHHSLQHSPDWRLHLSKLICPQCGYEKNDEHCMREHIDQHGVSKKWLEERNKRHLQEKMPWKCGECKNAFEHEYGLMAHLKLRHPVEYEKVIKKKVSEESRIKCGECRMKFPTKDKLQLHKNQAHPQTSVNSDASLSVHVEEKTDPLNPPPREVTCPKCGEKFPNISTLEDHNETVHIGRKCTICQNNYSRRVELRKHMRQSHPDECGVVICETGGKQFRWEQHLKLHVKRVHLKIDIPQSRHDQRGYVRPRKRMKYDEFKYKCDVCKVGYVLRCKLVEHVNKYHPNLPLDSIPV